jgi:hypothetical protein
MSFKEMAKSAEFWLLSFMGLSVIGIAIYAILYI